MVKVNFLAKGIVACCMLLLSSIMAYAEYPDGSPVAINGKLKVENGQLVNECGYPTQLRGMSTHGLAWNPDAYTEESIKTLVEDWNISLFRIAVYTHEWGGYTTNQWRSRDEYHQIIDNLVSICGKYGIYCLIDWHVLNQGSGNPYNTIEDATYFWSYMSRNHREDKHVIYEICNEPNGNTVKWSNVKKYADEIIPLIRKADPYTIIVCGTPTWSQDVDEAAKNPLQYDNIMYALHFYSGTHTDYLRSKANTALSKGLAIFVTEFGTSKADGSGGVYFDECNKWMKWMDDNNISWANWSFCDKKETSAALKPNAVSSGNWNDVSESGEYIKSKLAEPYKEKFQKCDSQGGELIFPELLCDTCHSVEDINNEIAVNIFPNPIEESFTIDAPFQVERIVIYDMLGKEVERIENLNNDNYITHNLQKGIYQVKIYGSKFITVKKLIKK